MRCTISRTLNYTDAKGREAELDVEIEVNVWFEKPHGVFCDFFAASYRDAHGQWVDVQDAEWLMTWVRDQFEDVHEDELYALAGDGF